MHGKADSCILHHNFGMWKETTIQPLSHMTNFLFMLLSLCFRLWNPKNVDLFFTVLLVQEWNLLSEKKTETWTWNYWSNTHQCKNDSITCDILCSLCHHNCTLFMTATNVFVTLKHNNKIALLCSISSKKINGIIIFVKEWC